MELDTDIKRRLETQQPSMQPFTIHSLQQKLMLKVYG